MSPRRTEPRNPVVVNSANEFTEVGYPTGGTPMPVNVLAGVINVNGGTVNVALGTFIYKPPATLVCGTKCVAGTATPETLAASTPIWNSIQIQALYSNVGTVFLKCSAAIPLSGIALVARDVTTVVTDDLAKIYVAVTTAGEGVTYLGC